MDLHTLIKPGIPWISSSPSLEFHGISQIIKSWSSMDFQLALSGISWNFTNHQKLEFRGIPAVWAWISMEFHKSPKAGILWNSMSRQMKIHGIPWRCLNSFFSTRIAKQVLIWYWYIVQSMLQRMRYEPSQSAIVGIRKNVPSPRSRQDPNRAFYLKNCERLRELKIGCYSFSDYDVCEIENVPSLEVIEMGELKEDSYNFIHASLDLKSDCERMK